MVIDGGTQTASQKLYSFIKNTLELKEIRYVIATHPHEDHIGGLPAVFNAAPVGLVLSPVTEWDSTRFQIVKRYAAAQAAEIYVPTEGDVFNLGKASFTIVHCWPEAWSVNDMSIALRLEYGNISFLFTGDAEQMAEYMMVDSPFSLESDVLHVSHHGSRSSSVPEFITSVNPKYAVISCSSEGGYYSRSKNLQDLEWIFCSGMRYEGRHSSATLTEVTHSQDEKDAQRCKILEEE